MSAPSYVQAPSSVSSTATSIPVTITGVTAGNLLVVCAQLLESGNRTFSCADDQGSTYQTGVDYDESTRDGAIFYTVAPVSGTYVVTVSISLSALLFRVKLLEFSHPNGWGTGTDPYDASAYFTDAVAADSHYGSDTPGITVSSAAVVVVVGLLVAAATSTEAGSGYTAVTNTTTHLIQYQTTDAGLTNERGAWTSVGTDRTAYSFMASFKAATSSSDVLTGYAYEVEG